MFIDRLALFSREFLDAGPWPVPTDAQPSEPACRIAAPREPEVRSDRDEIDVQAFVAVAEPASRDFDTKPARAQRR